jgi:hypothetical protein
MSRESLLVLLGILIALSPFSGLPLSCLMVALPVLGILVFGIGISLRARRQVHHEQLPPLSEETHA